MRIEQGTRCGKQAIVIGSSMVGLLAARVLSGSFDRVIVLERDRQPAGPEPRKGAPQGWHIHVLLNRGRETIARLFPGIFDELVRDGSVFGDAEQDLAWFHHGYWKARGVSGVGFYGQSRPLLEWHLRKRLGTDCPNVEILYEAEALDPLTDPGRTRITGLRLRRRVAGGLKILELASDLLVDASGRGSKMPRWLQELGYRAPAEEKVVINIGYTTRLYEQPKAGPDWTAMMIYPTAPDKKLGYIYPLEPDASGRRRWIVTMAGCLGDHAPMETEGFLNYARALARPDIYEWIRNAKPLTKFAAFKFPATRRLRYDRLRRLPGGFVSLGDALASFNPIFGQGISVGAAAVDVLEKLLRKGNLNRLPKRFFWRAHWLVTAIPWMLVTTEDFRYREAVGKRPFGVGIVQWYISHVSRVAAHDSRVVAEFLKVLHFMQTPAGLFKPYVLIRVIASMLGLYRGRVPHPEQEYVRLPPGAGLQARLAHERGDGNNMTRPRKAAGARRKQATPAKSAGRSAARTGARAGKKSRARARA